MSSGADGHDEASTAEVLTAEVFTIVSLPHDALQTKPASFFDGQDIGAQIRRWSITIVKPWRLFFRREPPGTAIENRFQALRLCHEESEAVIRRHQKSSPDRRPIIPHARSVRRIRI